MGGGLAGWLAGGGVDGWMTGCVSLTQRLEAQLEATSPNPVGTQSELTRAPRAL